MLAASRGVVLMKNVDRRWRATHLQCCRCLEVWFSREKTCSRCNARGHTYDWAARMYAGFPTHDWQGYLDTGPIPIVGEVFTLAAADVPRQRTTEPSTASVNG